MSKTMPNTPYWQKKSSTGNLEAQPWTAVILKAKLNSSIKQFLILKSIPKIDGYLFKEHILTLYDQIILNQFNISLNKNGKTVKVGKKTQSTITIKPFSFPAPSFGSKQSKVMIMEGKLKEVVNFHILRKHPTKYDFCLACRAIRAFVQFEFHHLKYKPEKKIKSGMGAAALDELDKMMMKEISSHPLIKNVEVTTTPKKNPTHSSMCDCMECYKSKNGPMGPVSEHDGSPLMKKPVITPAEMNMIMLKKHEETTADATKFLKQQEILDEDADLFKLENEDFDGSN